MKEMSFSEGILKELKKKKEIIFEIILLVIFVLVVALFFINVNQNQKNIFDYEKLLESDSKDYNLGINVIKNKAKRNLYSNQLDGMTEYENLLGEGIYKKKKEDPFYKSF